MPLSGMQLPQSPTLSSTHLSRLRHFAMTYFSLHASVAAYAWARMLGPTASSVCCCLQLLRAAAKALTAAAQAYNAVPAHSDISTEAAAAAAAAAGGTGAAACPSRATSMRRMHSRSRSNAAAIDLLAVAAGGLALSSPTGPTSDSSGSVRNSNAAGPGITSSTVSPISHAQQHHQHQHQHLQAISPVATVAAAASGLLGKQHQQQQQQHPGGAGPGSVPTAASLLPGIHLGPPGSMPVPGQHGSVVSSGSSSCVGSSGGSSGGRRVSRSSSVKAAPHSGTATASSPGAIASNGCPSPLHHPPAGSNGNSGSTAVAASCVTPCLAGCCAPSFAVGMLLALLYRGRFPEEYEAQWSSCPRLKVGPLLCRCSWGCRR